ncbi:thiamine-monophosphate kinase [Moraxella cuniculi DSM 21768]|uniref:Thiamine-monophosphate kinase n=1 Tax=Moraxella cuniculi DSM 21768 TaxID=1122245 RepID=A0A1N7FAP0_9GAMM|nr:thiamine-phosphate kinase [Moraxella cuniculi]OOS03552.1 thiamine-phosphate kinase [Moraxella cuniculi]SIR97393.1 thiamine-monophosphate kinase [Moraxella cuniculi DSM 21768]
MSEFSLIARYFQGATSTHHSTRLGIGDDCAISQLADDCQLVSCTDTLVSGRHFLPDTCPHAIAYKSVAVNLSDLAAMGATPFAILLALSLPKSAACDEFLGRFAKGIADICQQFGVELIGGDTTGNDTLTVTITALGTVPANSALYRHTAKIHDIICVSGEIGSANYALSQRLAGNSPPAQLQQALDYPMPQVALGRQLLGVANSMIDISDGLGQDLGHILAASGVGARLDLHKIPTNALLGKLDHEQLWQHQLNGGDDYQLLFTLSPEKFAEFNQHSQPIYAIGEIVPTQGLQLFWHDTPVDFPIKGWQHF